MASDYRVADTHDVVLGSLTVLSPQPKSEGVQATQRNYAADGTLVEQSLYVELVYDMIEDATKLTAMLTAFGVNSALTNEVTIYAPRLGIYTRYNGLVVQPVVIHRNYFFQTVTVLVKNLEVAA